MHKKLDLENTRIKNINIIYRMAKRTVTKHRRKLRNNKSRSKRHVGGGRRPRRSARKVKRSVRKGRRTRRMRGGSNGYTINGAGIGKYTSALANPIPFSAYPLNR